MRGPVCQSTQRHRRWDDLGEELVEDTIGPCWRQGTSLLRAPIGGVEMFVCGVHARVLERQGWTRA